MRLANKSIAIEVNSDNFDVEVLERSHEIPVLVDFWAPWCGPCLALGPILEELAAEYDGKFILAKANTETDPKLNSRFNIRSIPAVKLWVNGEGVAAFMGALPKTKVERFLRTNLPTRAKELMEEAKKLLSTEDGGPVAREKLREVVEEDPTHPEANLLLAEMALDDGEAELVEHHVEAIDGRAKEYEQGQLLLDAIAFAVERKKIGGEAAARARVEADEKDLDARYGLACCLAHDQRWEEALEEFLQIVILKPKWRDGAAKDRMVTIFKFIGHKSELADHYVRQLQIYS